MLFITTLLVVITIFVLIYVSRINLRVISVPSLFIIHYLLASFIGITFMYYKLDTHAMNFGVTDENRVLTLFFLSSLGIVTVCFTFMLLSKYTKRKWADFQQLNYPLSKRAVFLNNLAITVCIMVTLLYLYALPNPPIFAAFRGDFAKAVMLRTTLTSTNQVTILSSQFFNIFIKFILPFVLYVCIGQEMANRRNKMTLWVIIVFFFALFSSLIETGKGGFIAIIIYCFLIRMYIKKKYLNLRFILISLVVLLIASAVMMKLFMGTEGNAIEFVRSALFRIFTGNLIPAYHVLDLVDLKGDYYWGATLPNPRGIFPFDQVVLEQEVWVKLMGNTGDSIYSAPFPYWAEMYANFGTCGVFIASVIVGGGLFFLQVFSNSLPSNPVKIAFIIWSATYYSQLAVRGFSSFLFDYYFLSIVLIVFVFNYFNRDRHRLNSYAGYLCKDS